MFLLIVNSLKQLFFSPWCKRRWGQTRCEGEMSRTCLSFSFFLWTNFIYKTGTISRVPFPNHRKQLYRWWIFPSVSGSRSQTEIEQLLCCFSAWLRPLAHQTRNYGMAFLLYFHKGRSSVSCCKGDKTGSSGAAGFYSTSLLDVSNEKLSDALIYRPLMMWGCRERAKKYQIIGS